MSGLGREARRVTRAKRLLAVAVVAAVATLVPAVGGGALIIVPDPVGPWGYTNGLFFDGGFSDCNFYRVALGNGVAEELGTDLPCVDGLTFSPSGVLYAYRLPDLRGANGASNLVTINIATGAQSVVGSMGKGFSEGGMTFDKDGNLWLYAEPTDDSCTSGISCLYSVDPATGATTVVGGGDAFVSGLAADCATVYATAYRASGNGGGTLDTVDPTTGALTTVGSLGIDGLADGLDFAADGTLYTIAVPGFKGPVPGAPLTFTVSTATGAATNEVVWISEDPNPNVILGLAIAGLTCAAPEPPVIQPTFTG